MEAGEQCDVGLISTNAEDTCCNRTCHLKAGANCRFYQINIHDSLDCNLILVPYFRIF